MISEVNDYGFCLGTAMWAWTVNEKAAKNLLDLWYENGFRCVDTASNYPINKKAEDFRKAEQWLSQWLISSGVQDLKVMIKVGSIDNSGSPENRLNPSFLSIAHQHYCDLFSEQFDCLMIHWDNRDDSSEIQDSILAMQALCKDRQKLGFSGIKHPTAYKESLYALEEKPFLQAKHNPFQSHLDYYQSILPYCQPICYGLSGGGIKLHADYKNDSSASQRNVKINEMEGHIQKIRRLIDDFHREQADVKIENMHQLGMLNAALDERVSGLLIGPSKTEQLEDAIDFLKRIHQHKDLFLSLKNSLDD